MLEKNVGETPLMVLENFRAKEKLPSHVPLAYAGRLDPMASGKLLVLIGDECKRQIHYHNLDKAYEFEILFGFLSDSHDILGLASRTGTLHIEKNNLEEALSDLVGTITLPYPVFSSKTVHGKPLFLWKLEGRIDEIDIPTYESHIYSLRLLDTYTTSKDELEDHILQKISTIPTIKDTRKLLGKDFRRAEIRTRWQSVLKETHEDHFSIARIGCIASGGTYMRTLAAEIAKSLDTSGLAFRIHRTHIGTYRKLPFNLGFWTKQY